MIIETVRSPTACIFYRAHERGVSCTSVCTRVAREILGGLIVKATRLSSGRTLRPMSCFRPAASRKPRFSHSGNSGLPVANPLRQPETNFA